MGLWLRHHRSVEAFVPKRDCRRKSAGNVTKRKSGRPFFNQIASWRKFYDYLHNRYPGKLREWRWRKAAGVEPTRECLTPPTGFEARSDCPFDGASRAVSDIAVSFSETLRPDVSVSAVADTQASSPVRPLQVPFLTFAQGQRERELPLQANAKFRPLNGPRAGCHLIRVTRQVIERAIAGEVERFFSNFCGCQDRDS